METALCPLQSQRWINFSTGAGNATVVPARANRKGLVISAPTANCWCWFGTAGTADQNTHQLFVPAGTSFAMFSPCWLGDFTFQTGTGATIVNVTELF